MCVPVSVVMVLTKGIACKEAKGKEHQLDKEKEQD
jgi:hypothetical protein